MARWHTPKKIRSRPCFSYTQKITPRERPSTNPCIHRASEWTMTAEASSPADVHYIRSRISNACDGCKARKVKCDGKLPCSYCARRQRPESCHYSPQRQRQRRRRRVVGEDRGGSTPPSQGGDVQHRRRSLSPRESRQDEIDRRNGEGALLNGTPRTGVRTRTATTTPATTHFTPAPTEPLGPQPARQTLDASAEDDTEVPREARLLCDAQGKLIFIGDCAPLSLFQTIRQIVTTRVAHDAFAPQTSRYSVLENAPSRGHANRRGDPFRQHHQAGPPEVRPSDVHAAVAAYLTATTGLVDLFDNAKLVDDLLLWANLDRKPDDVTSVVNYLVLAIGRLTDGEGLFSQTYFEYACDRAYADLSASLSVGTVQVYILITIYMLCSCQINGAFLYFGIAVRAAHSVGLHRTEVNARFGTDLHRQRDRLWKSLRIVDLFLSTSMGRPPATSDVDCTVPYGDHHAGGGGGAAQAALDLLDASVQILLIIEGIVVQIYSRKKISLQLTEGVSLQLRDWSVRWLAPLKDALEGGGRSEAQVSGACQVLSSYYYAVMLVSRPFLMYELCRRLSEGPAASAAVGAAAAGRAGLPSGKSKLADACIDAASLMVDPILDLIERGVLNGRLPMLTYVPIRTLFLYQNDSWTDLSFRSWLFASSLVLGVGLLGGFGRILEKYTRMSIQALDHFAKNDTHATQYSLIAQSLLTTALEYLERRELQERMRRTESSSQLFGLIPHETRAAGTSSPARHYRSAGMVGSQGASPATTSTTTPRNRDILDRSFLQQNHQLGAQGPTSPPRLGDIDTAFLGLTESLLQTPDANYWNGNFGNDGDMGSALNLFPLLDAGGGIDLAHYLGSSNPA
ncbi:Filamentous growth regulator [Paramyrothecium foliicola]|nr:Filamentous growth regulator [Paramyrothecium foliicola]